MNLPSSISGAHLVHILITDFDYEHVHQDGTQVVLDTDFPFYQRITLPLKGAVRMKILEGVLGSVSKQKGISHEEILDKLLFAHPEDLQVWTDLRITFLARQPVKAPPPLVHSQNPDRFKRSDGTYTLRPPPKKDSPFMI